MILCVYAIRKKHLKTKRKSLFDLRFFYLSRGEEREDKRNKQRKSNTLTGQIVIYLVRVLPERESIVFVNREKHSLLQKTIQEIEKRKEKHNTQKIIKI